MKVLVSVVAEMNKGSQKRANCEIWENPVIWQSGFLAPMFPIHIVALVEVWGDGNSMFETKALLLGRIAGKLG